MATKIGRTDFLRTHYSLAKEIFASDNLKTLRCKIFLDLAREELDYPANVSDLDIFSALRTSFHKCIGYAPKKVKHANQWGKKYRNKLQNAIYYGQVA